LTDAEKSERLFPPDYYRGIQIEGSVLACPKPLMSEQYGLITILLPLISDHPPLFPDFFILYI
jgi:hypothetical protein